MNSGFVHTECSDCGLSDIISSEYGSVNIIDRYPPSGRPPAGLPLTITVEVRTFKTGGPAIFRTPFACLDAFVAVRGITGTHSNKILGGSFVRTSIPDCRGTAKISLDPSFRAGSTDRVQLELYQGGTTEWFAAQTTIEDVRAGRLQPISVSDPISLSIGKKEGIAAGVYSEQESLLPNWLQKNKMISALALAAALGAGAYILTPVILPATLKKLKSAAS